MLIIQKYIYFFFTKLLNRLLHNYNIFYFQFVCKMLNISYFFLIKISEALKLVDGIQNLDYFNFF